MTFVNLTPHQIDVFTGDNLPGVSILPSGQVARVAQTLSIAEPIDGLPTFRRTFGAVTGVPDPVEGVVLIVSALVAAACPRADIVSPGELVRNEAGQPIGCRGLIRSV